MSSPTLNSLLNSDLNDASTASTSTFTNFAKYMIAEQCNAFLENTITSTYILLNANNYEALAGAYERQTQLYTAQTARMKKVEVRVIDRATASEWDVEAQNTRSATLAVLAAGVPIAGIAFDQGSPAGAAGVAAAATAAAGYVYLTGMARTRRDASKLYWAPPA